MRLMHGGRQSRVEMTGGADPVAFGLHLSSNPDLPYRLQHALSLTPYVRTAFRGGDEKHYSDFPAYFPSVEVV
jgi:N-ethylmaleimide reductase